jgi:UDP-N-acetylglucosamine 2-epimerase (non-hydrolysing)
MAYRVVLSGQTGVNFKEFEKLIGKQEIYYAFSAKPNNPSPLYFALWSLRTAFAVILWVKKEFTKEKNKKSLLLVQGDTVTATIGAVASYFGRVKLVHVEAGLRSHNILEPFPEEICRNLISYFADINFCPNKSAFQNIKNRKGVKVDSGWNTSVEALHLALKLNTSSELLNSLKKKPYFIFILHRQEHMYIRKKDAKKLIEIVTKSTKKNINCLFIAHDVTKMHLINLGLWENIQRNKNIKVVQHLPFLEFIHVLKNADFIATDGGGNHTESHFLGLPCLILRRNTEQNEGIGENVVLSKEEPKIIENFINNYKKFRRSQKKISTWPSKIIVDKLYENLA